MTLFMYDSTDVNQIPLTAVMAAGYETGALILTTIPALQARLPNARIVSICVTSHQDGDVLDVEYGDARPWDAPQWATRQRNRGADPIVYCSTYSQYGWQVVKAAFAAQGVPLPWWWEANYDNVPVLSSDPRAVAKQYANARFTGRNLDISVVGPNWPGLSDVIIGPPAPTGQPVSNPIGSDWTLAVRTLDLSRAASAPIRGSQVRALQALLRLSNPSLVTDGIAGGMTRSALLTFQHNHGLSADAVAGPKTWAVLASQ